PLPEVRLADRRLPLLESRRRDGPAEAALRAPAREERPRRQERDRRRRAAQERRVPRRAGSGAEARLRDRGHRGRRRGRDPGRPGRAAAPAAPGEGLDRPRLSRTRAAYTTRISNPMRAFLPPFRCTSPLALPLSLVLALALAGAGAGASDD